MANYLKIAGLVLFIIGAILIILSHFLGWNNSNVVNLGSAALMVVALGIYIYAAKKVLSE
ncbi:MAG: hypothetical protein IKA52_03365 [Bacteroidaceae bacterium]|nr:hypothetical protein [Bacteroidaceae bacterium]